MKYRILNREEEHQIILDILKRLDSDLVVAGSHRKNDWEKGWAENLKSGNTTPGYFGKYNIFRINQRFVKSDQKDFEKKSLYSIVDEIGYRYLTEVKDIYEFGCGTGHNLQRLQKINRNARLHGFDWAKSSNKLINKIGFDGQNFDFFEPNFNIGLQPDAAVITVASLEQVGTRFEQFLKYILRNKPSIVVHIEPIPELLDKNNLLDYLSIKYMAKRKYLNGYLDTLKILESQKKIKIIEARRSGIGSMLIDGYSIIVWSPL